MMLLMLHGRKTHTEWRRIATEDTITGTPGDWKLVELPDESTHSQPLRTLAWVYTFDGLTWNIGLGGATHHAFTTNKELDGIAFGNVEEAKAYIEVLLRMES